MRSLLVVVVLAVGSAGCGPSEEEEVLDQVLEDLGETDSVAAVAAAAVVADHINGTSDEGVDLAGILIALAPYLPQIGIEALGGDRQVAEILLAHLTDGLSGARMVAVTESVLDGLTPHLLDLIPPEVWGDSGEVAALLTDGVRQVLEPFVEGVSASIERQMADEADRQELVDDLIGLIGIPGPTGVAASVVAHCHGELGQLVSAQVGDDVAYPENLGRAMDEAVGDALVDELHTADFLPPVAAEIRDSEVRSDGLSVSVGLRLEGVLNDAILGERVR